MIVAKIVDFHSAHHLLNYDGACANLHGHTWKAIFRFKVLDNFDLDQSGISIDFGKLKKALKDIVPDHVCINDWLQGIQVKHSLNDKPLSPSAEIMAIALALEVKFCSAIHGVEFHSLQLYETDASFVEVTKDDIEPERISRTVGAKLDRHIRSGECS